MGKRTLIYKFFDKIFGVKIDRCEKCGSRLDEEEIATGEEICQECIDQMLADLMD